MQNNKGGNLCDLRLCYKFSDNTPKAQIMKEKNMVDFIKIMGAVPLMKSSTQMERRYCQGISDKGLLPKCRKKPYNSAISTQTYPLDVGLESEYTPHHRRMQMTDNQTEHAFH